MKLIKAGYSIIEQEQGLLGVYKQIELAGRTCYKSECRITEDSAKEFVDRMVKLGHGAMLEHGTIYLTIPITEWSNLAEFDSGYPSNPYSKVNDSQVDWVNWEGNVYITTNARVLVENNWIADLEYICNPTEFHEKRVTVRFTTDQGILREFTRHRVFSFAVESTRYCNYSKSKFNNEITFIEPEWISDPREINSPAYESAYEIFCSACEEAEGYYFTLIDNGFPPQAARNVLPLATKCDMVMTGFVSDWEHFFKLRDASSAHPQARELAAPLHKEFKKKGLIKD